MQFSLFSIIAFSIIAPALIGFFRIRRVMEQHYLPLFLYLVTGLMNNIVSYLLIKQQLSNHVNSNIFVLLAFLLLLWQFYIWNHGSIRRYAVFGIIALIIWVTDNLVLNRIDQNNALFRWAASFTLLYFSVEQINKLVIFETRKLWQLPVFIICISFVLYYASKAFIETFNFFQGTLEDSLIIQLNITMAIVTFITHVFISIALLWIPRRPPFSFRY